MSPIIAGQAIKGPAAKMYRELRVEPSAVTVARQYQDVLSGFVLDTVDAALESEVQALGMAACVMDTLMPELPERIAVAQRVLAFGASLFKGKKS